MDQLRTVINRNDFDALRQSGFDFRQFLLNPVDDLEGVLSVAHDHDARHHFALAVQIGQAPAQLGSLDHFAHVLDADGRAIFACLKHDILEVLEGLRIAAAPNHVLRAAKLEQSSPNLVVAFPHSLRDAADGNTIGLETIWVYVDLVLAPVSADRSYFCHAGNRFQVVP